MPFFHVPTLLSDANYGTDRASGGPRLLCAHMCTMCLCLGLWLCKQLQRNRLCHTWSFIRFLFPIIPVLHFPVSHFQHPPPSLAPPNFSTVLHHTTQSALTPARPLPLAAAPAFWSVDLSSNYVCLVCRLLSHLPSCTFSKPYTVFLEDFSSFLSIDLSMLTTTSHEFLLPATLTSILIILVSGGARRKK